MKVDRAQPVKSEAKLLDQATNQLLKAVKDRVAKRQGDLDKSALRKSGYSDRFIERIDAA